MICPLCGKETTAEQFCSACGGDMAWAQANRMDVATFGVDSGSVFSEGGIVKHNNIPGLRPELAKNPALQQVGMARWLESTGMPDWLKSEIKKNERISKQNSKRKQKKKRS